MPDQDTILADAIVALLAVKAAGKPLPALVLHEIEAMTAGLPA